MSKIQKRQLLGLMIFTCLLMVLLAISLPALQMQSGEIFSLQPSELPSFGSSQESEDFSWILGLIQGLVIALFILLPVYIVIGLLSKEGRKKLLVDALIITLSLLIAMWLLNLNLPIMQSDEPLLPQPEINSLPELELDTFTPPTFEANPKPWMLTLIVIATAVLLAGCVFLALRLLSNRTSLERSPYLELADNAQTTLKEIEEAEMDFDDVIIRCYAKMSHTLQVENGIQRAQAMTTTEFEQGLLARGFPAEPIKKLTQLFEQVRYGRQQPMEFEKQVAVECMGDIIDYCRGLA
jgi:hypothetical protein